MVVLVSLEELEESSSFLTQPVEQKIVATSESERNVDIFIAKT
jgi:hypothetical protein